METKINLKKQEDLYKVDIYDAEGNYTGNYLEFDLGDIELPIRYNNATEEHKKNLNYIKMQFALIDKKPDKKGKKLLTSNEEEKYKVLLEYYEREIKAIDKVIGEGGTLKILNGRKPYYEMFSDIMEYLEPLKEVFSDGFKKLNDRMINKYTKIMEEDNVLKNE